jgi:hypothetical protein
LKLGVSYNLFDTEELLEASIKSIRSEVDYINVVYQTISNTGKPCSPNLEPILFDLKKRGLIDRLYLFQPDLNAHPSMNETKKRNIGLHLCKWKLCTHFLSMDSDEFYDSNKLNWCKQEMQKGNYDSSACEVVNYFKKPIYQMKYSSGVYYVSFINKIKLFSKFVLSGDYPVLVDPTRRINHVKKFKLFTKEEIIMNHMTLVRQNIRSKLESSTANDLYHMNNIDYYVNYFNNWELGDIAFPPSNHKNIVEIIEVENSFNITV